MSDDSDIKLTYATRSTFQFLFQHVSRVRHLLVFVRRRKLRQIVRKIDFFPAVVITRKLVERSGILNSQPEEKERERERETKRDVEY